MSNLWVWIACYGTPTTTKLDGISSSDMFAFVRKGNKVAIGIGSKVECTKVNPCTTTHLLVDMIGSADAFVYDCIFGLWVTFRQ